MSELQREPHHFGVESRYTLKVFREDGKVIGVWLEGDNGCIRPEPGSYARCYATVRSGIQHCAGSMWLVVPEP